MKHKPNDKHRGDRGNATGVHRFFVFLWVGFLGLMQSGCQDQPALVAPDSEMDLATVVAETSAQVITEPKHELALDLSANVSGSLRPGAAFTVHGRVEARVALDSVELEIWSPEVESARASGWGTDYRILFDVRIPPASRVRSRVPQGAHVASNAVFSVPQPGIYRVVVSGRSTTEAPVRWLITDLHKTIWVFVSETGGRVIPDFDRSLIPAGMVPEPGPFRPLVTIGQGAESQGSLMLPSSVSPGQHEVAVMHWDSQLQKTVKMTNHPVTFTALYRNEDEELVEEVDVVSTNGNGQIFFDCESGWETLTVDTNLDANGFNFNDNFSDTFASSCSAWPQGGPTLELPDSAAHVFLNLRAARSAGLSKFGLLRSGITVDMGQSSTRYFPASDKIWVGTDVIWNSGNRSAHHHEFGHAMHDTQTFGGIPSSIPGCTNHFFTDITSYECAFVEGFAEFFAELTWEPHPAYELETQTAWQPEPTGLKVEGAVAGFFLDLIDTANGEAWDSLSLPGSFLAASMRCFVIVGSTPRKGTKAHWVINCLENVIYGYSEGFFPSGDEPNSVFGPPQPPGWSLTGIRDSWMKNLFDSQGLEL